MILTFVVAFVTLTNLITALALPQTGTVSIQTSPPNPSTPPPSGPTCALVDGGESGGTFCNVWNGTGQITNTNWVTTVTPSWITPSQQPLPTPSPSQPSECGETGPFALTFDDLPSSSDSSPPIFNPVDHFWFGATFTYGPPPSNLSYAAHSGDTLAYSQMSANNTLVGSPYAGNAPSRGFGAGPRRAIPAYWFSISNAWVGCDFTSQSNTPGVLSMDLELPQDVGLLQDDACTFHATPYQKNPANNSDKVQGQTQSWVVARCDYDPAVTPEDGTQEQCQLQQIGFGDQFKNLTAINFYAVVGGRMVDFFIDDVQADWVDNSCEAGLQRISSRK